jgi:hypothetical protein
MHRAAIVDLDSVGLARSTVTMAVATTTMTSSLSLRQIFVAAIRDNFRARAVESASSTLTADEQPLSHVPRRPVARPTAPCQPRHGGHVPNWSRPAFGHRDEARRLPAAIETFGGTPGLHHLLQCTYCQTHTRHATSIPYKKESIFYGEMSDI